MITDVNDIPIYNVSMSLTELTESPVFIVKIPCVTGMWLKCAANPAASVKARPTGGGAFVDISTSPIDLTPYNGTTQQFDVKVAGKDVVGLVHTALPVTVTFTP